MEQLGNIGSEVSRATSAKAAGKTERLSAAVDRALELCDLTIADPKNKTRLRELCRCREVLCDFFIGQNTYGSDETWLNRYFLAFGLAARQE